MAWSADPKCRALFGERLLSFSVILIGEKTNRHGEREQQKVFPLSVRQRTQNVPDPKVQFRERISRAYVKRKQLWLLIQIQQSNANKQTKANNIRVRREKSRG